MKGFLGRLNDLCRDHEQLIQASGIFLGLVLLAYTAWSTHLTHRSLLLAEREERQRFTPGWSFTADDAEGFIRMESRNPSLALQEASILYPSNAERWAVNPPDFRWHVVALRSRLLREFFEDVAWTPDHVQYGERLYPVCVSAIYEAAGSIYRAVSLHGLRYVVIRTGLEDAKLEFKSVVFQGFADAEDSCRLQAESMYEELRTKGTHKR